MGDGNGSFCLITNHFRKGIAKNIPYKEAAIAHIAILPKSASTSLSSPSRYIAGIPEMYPASVPHPEAVAIEDRVACSFALK